MRTEKSPFFAARFLATFLIAVLGAPAPTWALRQMMERRVENQLASGLEENPRDGANQPGLFKTRREAGVSLFHVGDGKWIRSKTDMQPGAFAQEMLVRLRQPGFLNPNWEVLDLGTGDAVFPISISGRVAKVDGVEIDPEAAELARRNVELNQLDNIEIYQGDLTQPVRGRRYNLIIASPPAVPFSSFMRGAVSDEVRWMNDGGPDGRQVLDRILVEAPALLKEDGFLLVAQPDFVDLRKTERLAEELGLQMEVLSRRRIRLLEPSGTWNLFLQFREQIESAHGIRFRPKEGTPSFELFVLKITPVHPGALGSLTTTFSAGPQPAPPDRAGLEEQPMVKPIVHSSVSLEHVPAAISSMGDFLFVPSTEDLFSSRIKVVHVDSSGNLRLKQVLTLSQEGSREEDLLTPLYVAPVAWRTQPRYGPYFGGHGAQEQVVLFMGTTGVAARYNLMMDWDRNSKGVREWDFFSRRDDQTVFGSKPLGVVYDSDRHQTLFLGAQGRHIMAARSELSQRKWKLVDQPQFKVLRSVLDLVYSPRDKKIFVLSQDTNGLPMVTAFVWNTGAMQYEEAGAVLLPLPPLPGGASPEYGASLRMAVHPVTGELWVTDPYRRFLWLFQQQLDGKERLIGFSARDQIINLRGIVMSHDPSVAARAIPVWIPPEQPHSGKDPLDTLFYIGEPYRGYLVTLGATLSKREGRLIGTPRWDAKYAPPAGPFWASVQFWVARRESDGMLEVRARDDARNKIFSARVNGRELNTQTPLPIADWTETSGSDLYDPRHAQEGSWKAQVARNGFRTTVQVRYAAAQGPPVTLEIPVEIPLQQGENLLFTESYENFQIVLWQEPQEPGQPDKVRIYLLGKKKESPWRPLFWETRVIAQGNSLLLDAEPATLILEGKREERFLAGIGVNESGLPFVFREKAFEVRDKLGREILAVKGHGAILLPTRFASPSPEGPAGSGLEERKERFFQEIQEELDHADLPFPSEIRRAFEAVDRGQFFPGRSWVGNTLPVVGDPPDMPQGTQPRLIAWMILQAFSPERLDRLAQKEHPGEPVKVLVVGAGSGYSTALLDEYLNNVLGNGHYEIVSVEVNPDHHRWAAERLENYQEVQLVNNPAQVLGWPQEQPYDGILVFAQTSDLAARRALFRQLRVGGRLVLPWAESAEPEAQSTLAVYQKELEIQKELLPMAQLEKVRFVPLQTPILSGLEEAVRSIPGSTPFLEIQNLRESKKLRKVPYRLDPKKVSPQDFTVSLDGIAGGLEDEALLQEVLGRVESKALLESFGWFSMERDGQRIDIFDLSKRGDTPAQLYLEKGLPEPHGLPKGISVFSFEGDSRRQMKQFWKDHPPTRTAVIVWNANQTDETRLKQLKPRPGYRLAHLIASPEAIGRAGFSILNSFARIASDFNRILHLQPLQVNFLSVEGRNYAIVRSA